jgi:hypothetical protein
MSGFILIIPLVGFMILVSIDIMVVLPVPLGPSRAVKLPSLIAKSIWSTTTFD